MSAKLTVTDDKGCKNEYISNGSNLTQPIEIHPLPVVDFSVDPVCEGDTFSFRDNSFVDQTIFSDGLSPSNSNSPIFDFAGITSSNTRDINKWLSTIRKFMEFTY